MPNMNQMQRKHGRKKKARVYRASQNFVLQDFVSPKCH